MDEWWGGFGGSAGAVQRAVLLPRLFFQHFTDSSWLAESSDGTLRGFLVGFLSPARSDVAYIHFVGVDPHCAAPASLPRSTAACSTTPLRGARAPLRASPARTTLPLWPSTPASDSPSGPATRSWTASVLTQPGADRAGLRYDCLAARVILRVHSDLARPPAEYRHAT